MTVLAVLAALSAATWLVLAFGRGGFWRIRPRLTDHPAPSRWPRVAVVVPARDEAGLLPLTLPTLLAQSYPGDARVVLVDDRSSDGTAAVARRLAAAVPGGSPALPLTVVTARSCPAGWTGKLWALNEGLAVAGDVELVLFTDADIAHPPQSLARLVALAERDRLDQVSLMARLSVAGPWDRLLIPAFVYFFAMLYPFGWVSRRPVRRRRPPAPRRAAAAGGCLLVRRNTLVAAGGLPSVRGAVIDDVSLAQALARAGGSLWLGFADDVESVRPYEGLGGLWAMVARSAYVQLRCSPAALAGTVAGLLVVFAVPPVAAIAGLATGAPLAAGCGLGAWLLMAVTAAPMQRHHGLPGWRGAGLPAAAVMYLAMTVDSARQHHRGAGAARKGRTYGSPAPARDRTGPLPGGARRSGHSGRSGRTTPAVRQPNSLADRSTVRSQQPKDR